MEANQNRQTAVKYRNQPMSVDIMERELRVIDERRKETQAVLRSQSDTSGLLAQALEWSLGEKARVLHERHQQDLVHYWRMRPTDRLVALLLYWVEERHGGGLLGHPVEDEEDALLRRYLVESYWLATAHQWDKAFLHLAEMGRLLGSATLETLDLDSLYWLDVEVTF
jgi:hypothetical protein